MAEIELKEKQLPLLPSIKVHYLEIRFDKADTLRIAEGADIAGLVGVLPDPISIAIGVASRACAIWARSAVRRDKCLGIMIAPHYRARRFPVPIFFPFIPFLTPQLLPFEYRPDQPVSEPGV
jgi:hypothetical protein